LNLSVLAIFAYCLIKRLKSSNRTNIYYKKTNLNEKIVSSLGNLTFIPSIFLPNSLLQISYNEFKPKPKIQYKREYITNTDGGLISLDWVIQDKNEKFDKLFVILHGLTGGSNTCYIKETILGFIDKGYKIVVIQYRGINDTPLLTPLMFHGGFTDDLLYSLRYIHRRYNLPMYCMGISMGANIFTKFLATNYEEWKGIIKCLISLSNPYNLDEVEKRNRGSLMEKLILILLKNYLRKNQNLLELNESIDYDVISKTRRYREIDQHVILALFKNYNTVDDYYRDASCEHELENMKFPCLFLSSRDDVLSSIEILDFKKGIYIFNLVLNNEKLIFLSTAQGGHVCWFEGMNAKRVK
jgi:predicted alpha/beta-fold hydrolase